MAKKLIGITSGKSKEGKVFCFLTITEPCDETDNIYGSYGERADRVFVPEAEFAKIKPEDLGKEIRFDYSIRGDKARVTGFTIGK